MNLKKKLLPPLLLLIITLLFYPFWLIQFVLIMYVVVIFLSYLYSRVAKNSIAILREQKAIRIEAYEPITLLTIISNTGRLPIPWLSYTDTSGNLFFNHFPKQLFSLRPNEQIKISNSLKGYRRGVYTAGPVSVSGRDPMGMFPWEKQFPETQIDIIIYPEILSFHRPPRKGITGGPSTVHDKVHEDHNQYRGLRDYLPGDPLRTINWKASARFAKLQTMEYSNTLSAPACILLDLTAVDYPKRHRNGWIERAITAAATIAAAYCSTGQPVGFYSNGQSAARTEPLSPEFPSPAKNSIMLQPVSGYEQADTILSALAAISYIDKPEKLLPLFFRYHSISGKRIRLFHIGPPLSDEDRNFLLFLRHRGFEIEYFPATDRLINVDQLQNAGIQVFPIIESGPDMIQPEFSSGGLLRSTL